MELVLAAEGGYVNDPKDPGGETNWGISKRQYPDIEIGTLSIDRARIIYRFDYWDRIRADELPSVVRHAVFDAAVNSGVTAATKMLQRAAKANPDGKLGPVTMAAIAKVEPNALLRCFIKERLVFLCALPTFSAFGKGWVRRCAEALEAAT